MIKLILFSVLFFIVSCSSNDSDELVNDQSFYEDNNLKDFELFNLANDYIYSKQFDKYSKNDIKTNNSLNVGKLINYLDYYGQIDKLTNKPDYESKTQRNSSNYQSFSCSKCNYQFMSSYQGKNPLCKKCIHKLNKK